MNLAVQTGETFVHQRSKALSSLRLSESAALKKAVVKWATLPSSNVKAFTACQRPR